MSRVLLGIDAGTTNIKAVAFTPSGETVAMSSRTAPVDRPAPGSVEQDMETTWERTSEVITDVTEGIAPNAEILAVGVTGQGGGCWLLDGDGQPVRAAILWNDGRASGYLTDWRSDGTSEALFDQFGYGGWPGMPLAILRWLTDNEPTTLDRAETLLFAKDWVRYRLTGEIVTDPTDASLAHYAAFEGAFADELPDPVSVPSLSDLEPNVRLPTETVGRVTKEAATSTGIPTSTPVVAGMMDVAATSIGSGAVSAGDTSAVTGTTLQIQRLLPEPEHHRPAVGYTLALGIDGLGLRAMGAMTGTPNLNWIRSELSGNTSFSEIEESARDVPPGAEGLLYLPFLSESGEKAPFNDPAARAGFVGLNSLHEKAELFRAVYEGLVMSLRDCAENLPGEEECVYLSGGGAQSTLLCQLFADALDATVLVPENQKIGAAGAAIMAGIGVGEYATLSAGVNRAVTVDATFEPRSHASTVYDEWYDYYTSTYEALFDVWQHRETAVETIAEIHPQK